MTKPMPALTPADLEALSAYLDNELDPAARAEVERRLAAEPELRAALEELRAVVTRLHAAPLLRAPRDFRLDPAVYGRRPVITPVRRAYRWSSAISALAAVIVLALGVMGVLNRGQIFPGVQIASQSAGREAQSAATEVFSAASQPSALAFVPTATPQATPSPSDLEQEAPAEADTFAAPALDAANAAEPVGGMSTEAAADMVAESGFAPAVQGGQDAGLSDGTFLKETPEGMGGATGMGGVPPMAAAPQATPAVGEALAAQEESQAASAALSVPASSQPTQDDALGQRLAPTATLEIAAAELAPMPTIQPSPTMLPPTEVPLSEATLLPAPQPGTTADESQAAARGAPAGIDPALLIGGGLGLLALAGALYALSKR